MTRPAPHDHAVSLAANHRVACLALCAKLGWHGELVWVEA